MVYIPFFHSFQNNVYLILLIYLLASEPDRYHLPVRGHGICAFMLPVWRLQQNHAGLLMKASESGKTRNSKLEICSFFCRWYPEGWAFWRSDVYLCWTRRFFFLGLLTNATFAGTYSGGEIARGFSSDVQYPGSCYVHAFSAVYLLLSYAAPSLAGYQTIADLLSSGLIIKEWSKLSGTWTIPCLFIS